MKAHVLYLCALSSAVIYSADARSFLYSNSFSDTSSLIETNQTFESESQAALFLEAPALNNSYKTAGVYFITNNKGQVFSKPDEGSTFDDPSGKQCIGEGYSLTSCGGTASDYCPYNDKYFKTCCDASYKYDKSVACPLPQTFSEKSCGGKYRCECNASEYPITICVAPLVTGTSCSDDRGTRYTGCSCPTGVEAPYGCETYYASPCNSICQKAYADNCRNRESVQTPYGCEKYFSDCSSKCEKAYTDNCRNRTAVSAPYGCEKYFADCASKCEIAKIDNCANKTAVSTPYGCKKTFDDCPSKCEVAYTDNCHNRTAVSDKYGCISYFADCSSKCEKAYTDNCRNRTAVIDTCPKGATCTYYSDCSSKIEDWWCKYKYVQSGNVCLLHLPVLYGEGTVFREIPPVSGKTAIGVVIDEENHLAVALTDVKKDGTPGFETIKWSTTRYDIPDLENCSLAEIPRGTEEVTITCGVDGRANTDAILSCGDACGETPAATACNLYEPAGCTADFCKKGKWFLPSVTELQLMFLMHLDVSNTIFELPEGKKGHNGANPLWSSTEFSYHGAWAVNYRYISSHYLANRMNYDKYGDGAVNNIVHPFIKY